ncbi:hypothetical protein SEA_GIBBLES_45 [Gordonia phage Gibbles]|uniref:Uncharacterized protein n=3 Tax=Gordonia phage Orchid TaxID=1838075 RepID=A0A160DHE7_9CAUD|nr:hypothetical protein BH761_gp046 [Gordonia phage Orchid]ANA87281.1 hypothetical protein PBI_PATRICKSTAR_47 [Gordonia phage PatrickStar]ANA87508.1 hypothetical protein PBI_KAMPE_47 [Gordonia phage Kampe]AXH46498.1 hypothetical protein SEA_ROBINSPARKLES_50 [Gordonia phage RobinSparkles]QDK02004.1 hypothetical protein SEA_GIBBLES_45 [Gordonia phage Gibbles]ANA87393.1 hypothetical protein PBI_ORCHID_46 [Gordonia phage Orchid]
MSDENKKDDISSIVPHVTPMQEGMNAMKEIFDSYIDAGFTENQAIKLVAQMIKNSGEE